MVKPGNSGSHSVGNGHGAVGNHPGMPLGLEAHLGDNWHQVGLERSEPWAGLAVAGGLSEVGKIFAHETLDYPVFTGHCLT